MRGVAGARVPSAAYPPRGEFLDTLRTMRVAALLLAFVAPPVVAFQLPTSHRGLHRSRRTTCIVSAQASPADATALDGTGQMASKIAERLTEKLDAEWGDHEDHARVGGEAGRFYSEARAAGTVDIGELLMAVVRHPNASPSPSPTLAPTRTPHRRATCAVDNGPSSFRPGRARACRVSTWETASSEPGTSPTTPAMCGSRSKAALVLAVYHLGRSRLVLGCSAYSRGELDLRHISLAVAVVPPSGRGVPKLYYPLAKD